jgi:hypothetical protein
MKTIYLIWREGSGFSGLHCLDVYLDHELAFKKANELQKEQPSFKFFAVPGRLRD